MTTKNLRFSTVLHMIIIFSGGDDPTMTAYGILDKTHKAVGSYRNGKTQRCPVCFLHSGWRC